jgi:hypothetical protein
VDIPESINIRETMHGHGAKGMAFYVYADTGDLGIRMEARRKDGRSPFIETWFLDALPNREFSSFAALREAALPLTDAEIEAQTTACYPLVKDAKPDSWGNRCRLCPRPLFDPGAARVKHDTWRVTIAYSWKDLDSLSLCHDHLATFEKDPKGLRAAIEAEVAERRARAKPFLDCLTPTEAAQAKTNEEPGR